MVVKYIIVSQGRERRAAGTLDRRTVHMTSAVGHLIKLDSLSAASMHMEELLFKMSVNSRLDHAVKNPLTSLSLINETELPVL